MLRRTLYVHIHAIDAALLSVSRVTLASTARGAYRRDAVDAKLDAGSKQGCAGFRVLTAQLLWS